MNRRLQIHRLAARQYGCVGRPQAVALGLDRWALQRMVASGAWQWATPRVLQLVGAPADPRGPLMAATLDGGAGTVVARRSAGALWQLPGFAHGPVELSRQKSRRSRPPALGRLYTVRYLPDHLTTTVHGIPVVSLPYLLFQLAGFLNPARVERVLDTVITRSPTVLSQLHQLLPELARQGRDGIVVMRELLDERPPGVRVVASGLEARFERILTEAGQRPLERQVDVGGHEWIGRVDFLDREIGVLFEVDSQTFHSSKLDEERDRERDAALLAAGFRAVERVPEDWIWYEPWRAVAVVQDTRRRLRGRQSASGS